MGRLLALIGALIAAALIAWAAERPPEPAPAGAPATEFSAERAMADVRVIARVPHPIGSPANQRVRDHLVGRMTALGLSPVVRRDQAVNHRQGKTDTVIRGAAVENIIGVLPGRDRAAPAVAVMAHYDSVPGSPGAADDAAGVAAALEIARAIKAQGVPARDVMLVITDGEESGLYGAQAFFQRDPLARRAGLVINMEARGNGGRANMFQTSPGNGPLIDLIRRADEGPVSSSLAVFVYETMPNDTDFTRALEAGATGLNYAFIGRQFDYHSPTSTPATLDQGSLQDLGAQVLAATRTAAFEASLPGKGPDAVYSQVFGDLIIAYPAWAGWLALLAAAGLIALGVARARRIEAFPWMDALRGAGGFLTAVVGAATVLHFARRATGVGFGYVEQRALLAQITRWETACLLLALGFLILAACEMARGRRNIALVPLAAGVASSAFGGFDPVGLGMGVAGAVLAVVSYGRPVSRPGAWTGVLVMGLVLGAAAQAAAPATGYLIAWPLLLAGVGAAASAAAARRSLPVYAILALLAAVGLGWLGGTAHGLFLGLDMAEGLAAIVALAALLLWPLAQPEEGAPPARLVAHVLLGLGLAVLVAVRLNEPWTARHPQVSHVAYVLDQDTGRAVRMSLWAPTPWTTQAMQADGGRITEGKAWYAEGQPVWSAPAKATALPAPAISLVPQADGSLLLSAVPPAGFREIDLTLRSNTALAVEQAGGLPVKLAPKPGGRIKVTWEAAPVSLRLRPAGPGTLDVRYLATTDAWPAGTAPLTPRPAQEAAFFNSDSAFVEGTRRFSW